jgi:glycerol-3-phosphate O-acyltransferase
VRKLGPSPVSGKRPDEKVMVNLRAATNAAADFRLRVLVGRERELTEKNNVYNEKTTQEEFDSLLDKVVEAEFVRQKIHVLTQAEPLPIRALAEATNLKPEEVLKQIVDMRRRNMITVDHVEGTTPLFRALEVG